MGIPNVPMNGFDNDLESLDDTDDIFALIPKSPQKKRSNKTSKEEYEYITKLELEGILPNLDEDFAKLEANFEKLGDELNFGLDDPDQLIPSSKSPEKLTNTKNFSSTRPKVRSVLNDDDEFSLTGVQDADDEDILGLGGPYDIDEDAFVLEEEIDELASDEDDIDQFDKIMEMNDTSSDEDDMDVLEDFEDEMEDDAGLASSEKKKRMKGKGKDYFEMGDPMTGKLQSNIQMKGKNEQVRTILDDVDLDDADLQLGIDPPPLEEFKRFMDSLGPNSMYEDDDVNNELFAEDLDSDSLQHTASKGPDRGGMSADDAFLLDQKMKTDDHEMGLDHLSEEDEEDGAPFLLQHPMTSEDKDRVVSETPHDPSAIYEPDPTYRDVDRLWTADVYRGGPQITNPVLTEDGGVGDTLDWYFYESDAPSEVRCQVTAIVSNSTGNQTAVQQVAKIFQYFEEYFGDDPRIRYQTVCIGSEDGTPMKELESMIQMWIESYNTYHLIDGLAMKEAWGDIMPHIILSEKNLQSMAEKIAWALHEDSCDGALLTPRLRRLRFRGGSLDVEMAYNTESVSGEFSTINVR